MEQRGISSIGRASALHAEGQEFDSPMLHRLNPGRLAGVSWFLVWMAVSRGCGNILTFKVVFPFIDQLCELVRAAANQLGGRRHVRGSTVLASRR